MTDAPMADAQGGAADAYRSLSAKRLFGATAPFPWAGTRIDAECTVPREEWPAWWQAALALLAQLQRVHPPLAGWQQRAQAVDPGRPGFDPMAMGFLALLSALGVPDYPMKNTAPEPGRRAWYCACPYRELVQLGMPLVCGWLNWSEAARAQGGLELDAARVRQWRGDFQRLTELLPDTETMALHRRLWEAGIAWQWLGAGRTRVGAGARQRIVTGEGAGLSFANPADWRVPIYTVTGSVGKTSTVRLLSQLLAGSSPRIALAASDGAWIGKERLAADDCIGGKAASALLENTAVTAAIFEQGRLGIIEQGVPYAQSDVGVLLNVQDVHLGANGIDTLEAMAEVKARGLLPARLAVLNRDDPHCRRIGERRAPGSCIWFSLSAPAEALRTLSHTAHGAAGVERAADGSPVALLIWRGGAAERRLPLDGVAPYQGLLGEKTVEELLAVAAAGWFGPLPVDDWDARLRALRLDSANHLFRTSIHRQDNAVFVLDKAAEEPSLALLQDAVEDIARREGIARRILVITRPAGEYPHRHLASVGILQRFVDEVVCFDRPDTYLLPTALPCYAPGSIPVLLRDEFFRLGAERGTDIPVAIMPDWSAAEGHLRRRLAELAGKVLVLVNQPSTSVTELNDRIVAFANGEALPA